MPMRPQMDAPAMDGKAHRRCTLAVQPSTSQPSSYPSPNSAPRPRSSSSRNRPGQKPDPPQPASLSRVKRQIAMNTPPRGTSWLRDQSPMAVTPETPPRRSKSPEAASSPLVNPSSALLQDLLKEHRESRGSRATSAEPCDDSVNTPERSQPQEDTTSENARKVNEALSAGLKQPREMGMRETDQYISKINKQNFDLKLEIFHRTQQIGGLVKRLERMQELDEEVTRLHGLEDEMQDLRNAEEDNQRLRESNDELHHEIDQRDHAVAEAVELICQLEARVEELESDRNLSRPSTARPHTRDGSDTATPKIGAMLDIPERTSSKRATVFSKHSRGSSDSPSLERAPSFLRQENKDTAALRALFAPNEKPSSSTLSVLTKTMSANSMNGGGEPQSPRISALSECSELNPHDSPTRANGLDQLDIPVRKTSAADSSDSFRFGKKKEVCRNDRISSWMLPQEDRSRVKSPKQRSNTANGFYRAADTPSLESDLQWNGQSQKTPLEAAFGDLRLPPTPDTMGTSYANSANHSNGCFSVEKGHAEAMLAKRRIIRPHSADELPARWNSSNSALPDSMDANLSDATPFGLKGNGKDEDPAIFPLHGLPSKGSGLLSPGPSDIPSFGYYGGATMLDGSREGSISDNSSSPTLAAYDWIEAAKAGPRSRKGEPGKFDNDELRKGVSPMHFGYTGSRTPSQSSMARRHSVGSSVRDYEPAGVPTLDMSSLEPNPRSRPHESRRRISSRLTFFGRMNPRRLQSSGMCDVSEQDDGAPSPVIRKTRPTDTRPPKMELDAEGTPRDYLNMSARSATDKNGDYLHKSLPHSFTESNISNKTAARPSTANSKEHKRRSSLGILGWMKGASGIGSHKKAEPNSPVTTTRPNTGASKEQMPHSEDPELSCRYTPTAVTMDGSDGAANMAHGARMDDQDQRRRPRYIERRRRA